MSFDPRGYLAVADHLQQVAKSETLPEEAANRAAIGRYYYAAMLTARDLLRRSTPLAGDDADVTTHRWVIQSLRASADPSAQLLTSALNSMRATRNRAEYGEAMPQLEAAVAAVARQCRTALKQVSALERRFFR